MWCVTGLSRARVGLCFWDDNVANETSSFLHLHTHAGPILRANEAVLPIKDQLTAQCTRELLITFLFTGAGRPAFP